MLYIRIPDWDTHSGVCENSLGQKWDYFIHDYLTRSEMFSV